MIEPSDPQPAAESKADHRAPQKPPVKQGPEASKPNPAYLPSKKRADSNHSASSAEDEEAEDLQELLKKKNAAKKETKARAGVSAEVYGAYNKKEDFKGRFIKKTPEERAKIREKLMMSFMFKALDERDLETCIDAMEIKKYK